MTKRDIYFIGGGAAAGFVAAVAVVLLALEPLIRATGHWFGVNIDDQPVVLAEAAVLFQDEVPIGGIDPGLIAIRSTSRDKFDDYEVRVAVRRDLSPDVRQVDRPPAFVVARPASRVSAGDQ